MEPGAAVAGSPSPRGEGAAEGGGWGEAKAYGNKSRK